MGAGAGRVLCDDVLGRRMRTCVLSVSSTVGRLVGWSVGRSVSRSVGLSIPTLRLSTLVPRQKATISFNCVIMWQSQVENGLYKWANSL